MVEGLRNELLEAVVRGADSDITFTVGAIELEFAVELKADAKVKGGFKAWVVTGDVEAGLARGRTHKVKVTLTPKSPDGGDVLIKGEPGSGGRPGEVSGRLGRGAVRP
ncbi:trypco2 family protein [Streptosporangium sp. NPDC023615]|uniref:trypco2 family protein n=1 Tax=Streptosporangium sp. NPDC023615 TaxID=3154794 RepID=UPI0034161CD6